MRLLVRLASALALLFLALPLVVITGASLTASSFLAFPPQGVTLHWYHVMLADPSYVDSFVTSTLLAVCATALAISLAVPAAIALSRYDFRGKSIVSGVLLLPLVLPYVVLGAALLQFGSGFGLTRNFWALLAGHTVIVMPFVLRSVLAMMSDEQRALEDASMDLGASRLASFFLVSLPQIRPGLVAGSIFAFITSWINVELSIFNTTAQLNTLPVKLFNYVEYTIDPTIAAASALTIIAATVTIVVLDLTIGLDVLSQAAPSR